MSDKQQVFRTCWEPEDFPNLDMFVVTTGVHQEHDGDQFMVWITFDGQYFSYLACFHEVVRAKEMVAQVTRQIRVGVFSQTEEMAIAALNTLLQQSEFPVPQEVPERIASVLRQQCEAQANDGPPYAADLSLLQWFVDQSTESMRDKALYNRELARETRESDTFGFQQLTIMQHVWCLRNARVDYLASSALKMCDAMMVASPLDPEFSDIPRWLQLLAPRQFRGGVLRGIFLYDAYNKARVDLLLEGKAPSIRDRAKSYVGKKQHCIQVEFLHDIPNTDSWQATTTVLGEYDTQRRVWSRIPETHHCPDGFCTTEALGESTILIQCESCLAEFDYWQRWIKTLYLVVRGDFRRVDDPGPEETVQYMRGMTLMSGNALVTQQPVKKGKKLQPQRTAYRTRIVQFDASYMRPARQGKKRGPMADTHIILSEEEALREGALEIDMDGVLVRDYTDRAGFIRHLNHPRYKKATADVKPRPAAAQLVSLATWKAREKKRSEALHKQKLVYSSEHE